MKGMNLHLRFYNKERSVLYRFFGLDNEHVVSVNSQFEHNIIMHLVTSEVNNQSSALSDRRVLIDVFAVASFPEFEWCEDTIDIAY